MPGHWHGYLVSGSNNSHIVTLVERHTLRDAGQGQRQGYRDGDQCLDQAGVKAAEGTLPFPDMGPWQGDGRPQAFHNGDRYQGVFCDPQSPWQRGSNENTNGML